VLEREWTFTKTTSDARKKTHEALDVIVSKIADLYDSSDGTPIYVPDTNAILANPELEEWKFGHRFTIHLTPTVLRELDEMKVHRNPDVAAKAEGVIRRIKGYRDRGGGSLRDPVPLRSGRSTLQAGAVEPNMNETLPWLDPENRDDRIIASVIETMRSHVRSPVTLVTRDLNMQNKASHAAIPYIEPPEAAK
jgi:predicted ribonuclease YlaK